MKDLITQRMEANGEDCITTPFLAKAIFNPVTHWTEDLWL